MNPKAKKYLITEESHEVLVVRRKGQSISRTHCRECGTEVDMLTADAAVTGSGRSSRELFRLIEAGVLHSVETGTGHVLICRVSLSKLDTAIDVDSGDDQIGKE